MALVTQPDFSNFSDLPEKDVWDAFRNGNKEALEAIYRKYISELFIYGMKIKGHENLIKDCIQELFIELWNSKNNLSSTTSIKYYLLRALKYKINHHLKQELKFSGRNFFFSDEFESSHETKLINKFTTEEKEKEIQNVLKQLPARQKEIIHLLFYQELSYEKISEIMEINVKSVYTLAWKAISFLRTKIK